MRRSYRTCEDAFKFGCNAIQLTIVDGTINSNGIVEETRKFLPTNYAPKITITNEHLKPNLYVNNKIKLAIFNQDCTLIKIPHNLPRRDYLKYVGREKELETLLTRISPDYRQYINTVEGIGGVGKTALVVEAAYFHLNDKVHEIVHDKPIAKFDAIIFTTAKLKFLTPKGEKNTFDKQENLQDIFCTIAEVLEEPNIIRAKEEKQLNLVRKILNRQNTLLIVDNMETLSEEEHERVLGFLTNLPESTQAILTTREKTGMFQPIRLTELSKDESLELIKQEVEKKGIEITQIEAENIHEYFGGIPVALIYAIGQKDIGYSFEKIYGSLTKSLSKKLPEDLTSFLFENSIAPLRNQAAHKLLMSMTLFVTPPVGEALCSVAGLSGKRDQQEKGLEQLQQLSFLSKEQLPFLSKEKERYKILPITRQFALDEIEKCNEFKKQAQMRLIEFYLEFTNKHGGKDWKDWIIDYDHLDREWENIQFVLSLCSNLDKYREAKQIWQNIDHFVDLSSSWQVRLQWWEWLVSESDRRGNDLPTYVKAISEKAWTLILMKNPENKKQAEDCLQEAWDKKEFVDLDTQAHIANHFAVYKKTEKQYEKAFKWLNIQESLVKQSDLPGREKNRHRACINFYRAEIYYLQSDFPQAKQNFESVIELGTKIQWQRFTNYAQNYLADILISENDLSSAKRILTLGLYWAERSKEKRRIAHWQASHARYEQAIGSFSKAKNWAEKALIIFKQECMQNNIQKMELLLASLQ